MIPTMTFSEEEIQDASQHRLYLLMCEAYKAMMEAAEDDGHGNKIWRGKTTELFPSIGAHVPEHSYITRLFTWMDVAQKLKQGHRGSPSEWVLVQEPKPEIYLLFKDRLQDIRGGKRTSKLEVVREQQGDLRQEVRTLRRYVENLIGRVETFEDDYDARRQGA